MDYKVIGFIKASKHRYNILTILENNILTPKEISNKLHLHLSQVSRTLNELSEANLVECETPSLRKGKLHTLTEAGKACLKNLRSNLRG